MKLQKNRWYDGRRNSWDAEYYSKDQAKYLSSTLIDCYYCKNSYNCVNCFNAVDNHFIYNYYNCSKITYYIIILFFNITILFYIIKYIGIIIFIFICCLVGAFLGLLKGIYEW